MPRGEGPDERRDNFTADQSAVSQNNASTNAAGEPVIPEKYRLPEIVRNQREITYSTPENPYANAYVPYGNYGGQLNQYSSGSQNYPFANSQQQYGGKGGYQQPQQQPQPQYGNKGGYQQQQPQPQPQYGSKGGYQRPQPQPQPYGTKGGYQQPQYQPPQQQQSQSGKGGKGGAQQYGPQDTSGQNAYNDRATKPQSSFGGSLGGLGAFRGY